MQHVVTLIVPLAKVDGKLCVFRLCMLNKKHRGWSSDHNHMLFVSQTVLLSFDMVKRPHSFILKAWNLSMNRERLCMWLQHCKISRISLCLNHRNHANSISKVSKHWPKACQFGLSPCDPGMGSESLWKQWRGESAKRMPLWYPATLISWWSHHCDSTVCVLTYCTLVRY